MNQKFNELKKVISNYKLYLFFQACLTILAFLSFFYRINFAHVIIWDSPLFFIGVMIFQGYWISRSLLYLFTDRVKSVLPKYDRQELIVQLFNLGIMILLIIGFSHTYFVKRQVTFDEDFLVRKNLNSNKLIFHDNTLEKNAISLKGDKVLVFFKFSCPECQKTIPKFLNGLDSQDKVYFINFDRIEGQELAKKYNIEKPSRSIVITNGKTELVPFSKRDQDGEVIVEDNRIDFVLEQIKEIQRNS